MAKGKMNVYGCGGAGINIARHIANRSQEFNSERLQIVRSSFWIPRQAIWVV